MPPCAPTFSPPAAGSSCDSPRDTAVDDVRRTEGGRGGPALRGSSAGAGTQLSTGAARSHEAAPAPGVLDGALDRRATARARGPAESTRPRSWRGLRSSRSDWTTAESAARELVERAPLHESGYELLMRVLAKRRNVADALGVYERLRTVLREQLGAAPGAAVRTLHASLLADGTDVEAQRPVAMTVAELGELTRSIGAARVTWEHLVRHDPKQRLFERLSSPPGTEAWLMCWMPGQDSGPHDHDISSGAITVVEGELTEERFGWEASASPTAYGAGETFAFGPSDVHRVVHSERPRPPRSTPSTTAAQPRQLRPRPPRRIAPLRARSRRRGRSSEPSSSASQRLAAVAELIPSSAERVGRDRRRPPPSADTGTEGMQVGPPALQRRVGDRPHEASRPGAAIPRRDP